MSDMAEYILEKNIPIHAIVENLSNGEYCTLVVPFDYPHSFAVLPANITSVRFDESCCMCDEKYAYDIDSIPDHVVELVTNPNLDQEINHLPRSLKKLTYYSRKSDVPMPKLPEGLTHLTFDARCGDLSSLPQSITDLEINVTYVKEQLKCFPNNLKNIKLTGGYDYYIDNLPDSVEVIDLRDCFFENDIKKVPAQLKKFYIAAYYGFRCGKLNQLQCLMPHGSELITVQPRKPDICYTPSLLSLLGIPTM